MQTIQAASANKTPLFKDSTTSDTNKKQNIVLQGIKKYSLVTILFGFIPIFLRTFPLVSYIFYVPFLNIILFFLLFITYFKLTKKISEWFSPINSTYIVILVSTSLILNFIIANFICAISIFFQCWYHILDFYTLGGVIGISDIHLIIFTAFVTRKIVDFASKKEKLNIRDIVCSLLFLCLAIFTFIQLINFWKQEIIRGQEERVIYRN